MGKFRSELNHVYGGNSPEVTGTPGSTLRRLEGKVIQQVTEQNGSGVQEALNQLFSTGDPNIAAVQVNNRFVQRMVYPDQTPQESRGKKKKNRR